MATYLKATGDVAAMVRQAADDWHSELREQGVRFGVTFVFAPRDDKTGEPKGPAIKDRGHPCCAAVKINSLADRVEGKEDMNVRLDGDNWKEWSTAKQFAVIDHALASVEIVSDEDGAAVLDDANRPKIRKRTADIFIVGYTDVISRHGAEAIEARAIHAAQEYVQGLFEFEPATA